MSKAYYNEIDPKAAAWLRELIKSGLIADGDVDERSIADVTAGDIAGYAQCHFFAGIGGWSYALRLAGIPDDYPVWTGSCPCQPFSAAGKNNGKADDRHLWPEFSRLIKSARPITVFGEQVEGAVKHRWIDDLQADMEAESYTVGAAVLGAHSVGSFHQRQRIYWVANSNSIGCNSREANSDSKSRSSTWSDCRCAHHGMADSNCSGFQRRERAERTDKQPAGKNSLANGLGNTESSNQQRNWKPCSGIKQQKQVGRSGLFSSLGYSHGNGCKSRSETTSANRHRNSADSTGWNDPEWIQCRDNKFRPIKSGLVPLANGIPARVVRLRGYGNAIVPQVAAEFISAFYEVVSC